MNAKTLEAVRRHGETLLAAFPNATERDPVALCKKLRRIETTVSAPILRYCNDSTMPEGLIDTECDKALRRTMELLGLDKIGAAVAGLFVNRDPQGYALKLGGDYSSWIQHWQNERREAHLPAIEQDWGGYAILAPDLTRQTKG